MKSPSDNSFLKSEAVFYALRKTRDGIVVSFVLHPNELSDGLTRSPIGTRVLLAVAEVSDEPAAPEGIVLNSQC